MRLTSLVLLSVLLVGCGGQTGVVLEVEAGASPTSIEAGVAELELVTAKWSWCERWVRDQGASGTKVAVADRDLAKRPYRFMVQPAHTTDLAAPVLYVVLARDAQGKLIGQAYFGAHPFEKGVLNSYQASINYLVRRQEADPPRYVSDGDNACVCLPGVPWVGNGSMSGCDNDVVPSLDRLIDTAGCELRGNAPRQLSSPVCDGQGYFDESVDRRMPCYVGDGAACAIAGRTCNDHQGQAYDHECVAEAADPKPPTARLCAAYAACERQACGDLVGCFLASVPATRTLDCFLAIDPSTPAGMPVKVCGGTAEASLDVAGGPLTGAACTASVIDGRQQRGFGLGLKGPGDMATETQTRSNRCPPTLVVQEVRASAPDQVADLTELDLTIGDDVIHLNLHVTRGCGNGPTLVCKVK